MGRYLVSGAAGFIGSRVSELLMSEGHEVVGVDDLNDAYDVRLKDWRLNRLRREPLFTFHKLDIRSLESLEPVFAGNGARPIDAVVNLAARAGVRPSVDDPWLYYQTNLTGALNLLELCRRGGIRKFVLASTSSVYGQGNPMPYSEDQGTDSPRSPYAASKKAAETLCESYRHLHGIDVTVLRFFTVFGPAGRPDMSLFRFVQRIIEREPITVTGDGSQSRDFTYVDDVARGTIRAIGCSGPGAINLGSDRPVQLIETVRLIERLTGEKARIEYVPMHASDVMATWADISRARERLGWRPCVSLEEGVEQLVRWYRDNRDWARDVVTA